LVGVGSQTLSDKTYETVPEIATTVVVVSGGYPGDYEKGKPVQGLQGQKQSIVFHSGTKLEGEQVLTNGGRVFAITSFGRSIRDAVDKSFATAAEIKYEGKYFRRDIGADLINYK
jgi:phosphoribosylamine--glycine ligase